jgi:hypothetical protein
VQDRSRSTWVANPDSPARVVRMRRARRGDAGRAKSELASWHSARAAASGRWPAHAAVTARWPRTCRRGAGGVWRTAYRQRLRGRGARRRSRDGGPGGARCARPGRRLPSAWRATDDSSRGVVAAFQGAGAPRTTLDPSQSALRRGGGGPAFPARRSFLRLVVTPRNARPRPRCVVAELRVGN